MSRKSIGATSVILALVVFSVFSFSSVLALAQDADNGSAQPLTSARALCDAANASFKADVAAVRAYALSLHLPKEELQMRLQSIRDYRKQVCAEARAAAQPLTSAVKLCAAANRSYASDVSNLRAVALSTHMSKEALKERLQALRDYRSQVCKEAKAERAER